MDELERDPETAHKRQLLEERRKQLLTDIRETCQNPATVRFLTHIFDKLCLGKPRDAQGLILAAAATAIFSDIKQASPETARKILLDLFGFAEQ